MRRLFERYPLSILLLLSVLVMSVGCFSYSEGESKVADDDDGDMQSYTAPVEYVNPFIGTGGWGFGIGSTFPGPKTPFGMVALSPDTSFGGTAIDLLHCSGYYYYDTHIRGFSHTHLSGTGAADYGAVLLMPTNGFGADKTAEAGYRSGFSHSQEHAEAGFYSVRLLDSGIDVELTATDFAGVHRYTYPPYSEPYVIINPSHSIADDWIRDAEVSIDPDEREVSGFCDLHGEMTGRDGGVKVYFAARFSRGFADFGTWSDGVVMPEGTDQRGSDIGAYVGFESKAEPVVVKVGISYQSVEQARANLEAQVPDFDFDRVRRDARERWNDVLSKIEVAGATEREKEIFYTALYHSYMMPSVWTETNGKYVGFDIKAHDSGEHTYYADFSLWDTFRTLHPLMFLIEPDASEDMMQSLVRMYEQGGAIPKWALAEGYTGSMVGTSADIVLAEAYLKGLRDFDYETAYQGCYEHATGPVPHAGRGGLDAYHDEGYICVDIEEDGVSLTLEYCYDDAALALWAHEMGLDDDYEFFKENSHNWKNYWDPTIEFLRQRNCDGTFVSPFSPNFVFSRYFVEGNAWHWLWYVPHDVKGLIGLFSSEQRFIDKLNYFFENTSPLPNDPLPPTYYWHGNEPDIFSAYLFNWTPRADLAQKWARWIADTKYADNPDGIDGNDDCGTMSAWYIFSALGFFPVAGTDMYVLGSPIFDRAIIHLDGGELVVTAENNSPENVYVQEVYLNGYPLASPYFRHEQIAGGGELRFVMSPFPKTDWQPAPSIWELVK